MLCDCLSTVYTGSTIVAQPHMSYISELEQIEGSAMKLDDTLNLHALD